jgi:hypothetical protein
VNHAKTAEFVGYPVIFAGSDIADETGFILRDNDVLHGCLLGCKAFRHPHSATHATRNMPTMDANPTKKPTMFGAYALSQLGQSFPRRVAVSTP